MLSGPFNNRSALSVIAEFALELALITFVVLALISQLSGCVSNTAEKTEPDAAVCPQSGPGYRSCDWAYVPGDDCRTVCCDNEDWIGAPQDTHCAISGRKCTSPSLVRCLIGVTPPEPDGGCP